MTIALDIIEKATGLVAGRDYYFTPGRTYPSFLPMQIGMFSTSMVDGYKVVKEDKEIVITPSNPNKELIDVINFLDGKLLDLVDSK